MGDFNVRRDNKMNISGVEAIEKTMKKIYPDKKQQIDRFAVLQPWRMGGEDPLDIIDIYDGGEYFHFVTYGLTELYDKETNDPEYSGFGFELTFKLKKSCIEENEEEEQRCFAGILQAIARVSYKFGEIFGPAEYIYTGSDKGVNVAQDTLITGFVTKEDTMGTIDTPNGKVQFVELIGATDAELRALEDKQITVQDLIDKIGTDVTDYHRQSVI